MEWLVRVLNKALSFVAFVTAATLVVYMLVVIVTGTLDVANLMLDTILLESDERQSVFSVLNGDFLHNIAVLLIMMKAYRILVEYMRYHHIDLKYMVEIAVIACVLELLFNASAYSPQMQIVLAFISITFLAIYTFRYDSLVRALNDTKDELKQSAVVVAKTPPEEPVVVKPKTKPRKRAVRKVATK